MKILAYLLAALAMALGALSLFRVRSLNGIVLWIPKLLAGSASIFIAGVGALAAALGWLTGAPLAAVAGLLGALLSLRYALRVTARHDGFERAFGLDWQDRIAPEQRARLLGRRWMLRLPLRRDVLWQRDLPFWKLPCADRQLLCDLWQPPRGVDPSGLAFIYLHGGAWHWMDKDFGTRPFFRHLAAQGHVVMDVAYRMCLQVDIYGMIGDVKRAIAWMKANAEEYDVDPACLVVAGGSAGAHLALLAAYAPDHPELTPDDLRAADLSVRAVVGCYGPADMCALYRYFDATFGDFGKWAKRGVGRMLSGIIGVLSRPLLEDSYEKGEWRYFSLGWLMANLLGGSPDELPQVYELVSPLTHAGPDSPPTLLLQGEHDCFSPAQVARGLHRKLVEAGVPSVYVEFPQTEHGFDLVLPRYAPAAQAAFHDVDRFLGLMLSDLPRSTVP